MGFTVPIIFSLFSFFFIRGCYLSRGDVCKLPVPMYLPVGLKKHDIRGKRYMIALKTSFLIASTSLPKSSGF